MMTPQGHRQSLQQRCECNTAGVSPLDVGLCEKPTNNGGKSVAYSMGRVRIHVHAWMATSFGRTSLPAGIHFIPQNLHRIVPWAELLQSVINPLFFF